MSYLFGRGGGGGGRYGEGVIGQGFASTVWDLAYITVVGECEACKKVVDRNGFFITAEGTV